MRKQKLYRRKHLRALHSQREAEDKGTMKEQREFQKQMEAEGKRYDQLMRGCKDVSYTT